MVDSPMFEHPFIDRKMLEEKTLDELQSTITGLYSKLNFAIRTGNRPLINQLQMMLVGYNNQYRKKTDELFDKQSLNTKINIQGENAPIPQAPITPFKQLR